MRPIRNTPAPFKEFRLSPWSIFLLYPILYVLLHSFVLFVHLFVHRILQNGRLHIVFCLYYNMIIVVYFYFVNIFCVCSEKTQNSYKISLKICANLLF